MLTQKKKVFTLAQLIYPWKLSYPKQIATYWMQSGQEQNLPQSFETYCLLQIYIFADFNFQ